MSDLKKGLDKYLTTPPEDGNIESEIFALFVGDDKMRPQFLKPFKKDGKIYATDQISIIRCDESDCELVVDDLDNPHLKISEVFPTENMRIKLEIDKSIFEQCKTEDEYIYVGNDVVCKECDGTGQVEWTYKHHTQDLDCPVCDGDGLSERKQPMPTGNKTFGFHFVKICSAYIRIYLFYRLIEAQALINNDIYITYYQNADKGIMFKIGEFDIVLMPSMTENLDFSEVTVIDVLGANLTLLYEKEH